MQNTDRTAPDQTANPGFRIAGILGALAVGLGAFGAHGLKSWLKDDPDVVIRLGWWETATHYHLAHALLAAVFALLWTSSPRARTGLTLSVVGVAIFSGSLYLMTLTNIRLLGAITPIGGLALIGAWICLGLCRPRHR